MFLASQCNYTSSFEVTLQPVWDWEYLRIASRLKDFGTVDLTGLDMEGGEKEQLTPATLCSAFLGVLGVGMTVFGALVHWAGILPPEDQGLGMPVLVLGILFYLAHISEALFKSKTSKYLYWIMSETDFQAYVKELQESQPKIKWTIQNYHYEEKRHRDKDGKEHVERKRVNTHSAEAYYDIGGFLDETLSPAQMIAMFHLMYDGEQQDLEANKKKPISRIFLLCEMPLEYHPVDDQEEQRLFDRREAFWRDNTRDTHQDKSTTDLIDCGYKSHVMVILREGTDDSRARPWWMQYWFYAICTIFLMSGALQMCLLFPLYQDPMGNPKAFLPQESKFMGRRSKARSCKPNRYSVQSISQGQAWNTYGKLHRTQCSLGCGEATTGRCGATCSGSCWCSILLEESRFGQRLWWQNKLVCWWAREDAEARWCDLQGQSNQRPEEWWHANQTGGYPGGSYGRQQNVASLRTKNVPNLLWKAGTKKLLQDVVGTKCWSAHPTPHYDIDTIRIVIYCNTNLRSIASPWPCWGVRKTLLLIGDDPIPIPLFCMSRLKDRTQKSSLPIGPIGDGTTLICAWHENEHAILSAIHINYTHAYTHTFK